MRLQPATDPTSKAALSIGQVVLHDLVLPTAIRIEQTLARNDDEPSLDALWPTFLETTVFCCHCLDRIAFTRVGPERRLVVMDCVLLGVVESLCNRFETTEACDECCDTFFESWTRFQKKYAHMELTAAERSSPKGTMLWEWTKDMTFRRQAFNPAIGMLLYGEAAGMLTVLADSWDALWQSATSTAS